MSSARELPPNLSPPLLRFGFRTAAALDSDAAHDRRVKLATSERMLLLANRNVPLSIARLPRSMGAFNSLMTARYALQLNAARNFTAFTPDGRTQLWQKFWLTDRVRRRFAFIAPSVFAIATSAVREVMHLRPMRDSVASKRRPEAI